MPRSQQAKHSFSGGLRTPRVSLRSDYNPYVEKDSFNESCSILNNWIVTPQGGIQFREGLRNFGDESLSSDPTEDSRCFTFRKGGEESDLIIHVTAGDGLIHFMQDGVMLAYTVSHNYLQAELEELWFTNQEKIAIILHKSHPPIYINVALDGSITGEELESALVPFTDYNDEKSPTATVDGEATYNLDFVDGTATTWNPSRNWILRYGGVYATGNQGNIKEYEFSSISATLAAQVEAALDRIPALQGSGTTVTVIPGAAGTDWDTIDITIDGENGGLLLELFPANESADRYVTVTASIEEIEVTEPIWSFPTYVLEGGVYYQCLIPHVPAVANQPPNATYWTPLGAKPDTFDWQYPDGNAWDVNAVQYSPGGRGFPTVGVFYQQRLLLMANPSAKMGVSGSRIANYRDFKLGPQDDDPFFFAIDTSDSPKIKWAQAQRKLIIGTSSGDYSLQSDITLTPSNVQATKQNAARSHGTDAVTVNTDIFYIELGQEKMRKTSWVDNLQAQNSQDVSLVVQNLFVPRAKRLALCLTPEVLIYALRDDGTLICLSYSAEEVSAAWSEITMAGTVIDICAGYNAVTSEDELWCIVTYDGGTTRWIEKMPYPARRKTTDPLVEQTIVCLDGWISGSIIEGDNNVIQGLDQFEGLTVTVMVDDAYAGEYEVFDGALILDAPDPGDVPAYSGTYAVGFAYTGPAKTFEVVDGNPNGVGFGTKRRWNQLYVRLLDSSLPKINGQLPSDRSPSSLMSTPEIIRSGTQDLVINNLGSGDGSITILQDRPYPCHILGFYGQIQVENS